MAVRDGKVAGAAVTEIIDVCDTRLGVIVAAAGDLVLCREFMPMAERFFTENHCDKAVIYGRRGWQRILTDYEPQYVAYSKELP